MGISFFAATGMHDDRPDLDVNQSNGRALLELLGLWEGADSMSGSCPADEFAARVAAAQSQLCESGDDGVASVQDGNFIYCGRRPGYFGDRLQVLERTAAWAAERSAPVCWG